MLRNWEKSAVFVILLHWTAGVWDLQAGDLANGPGLLFRPVEICTLLDSKKSGAHLGPEALLLEAEGSCSPRVWQGRPRAAMVQVEVMDASEKGALKLWSGRADNEPEAGVMIVSPAQLSQGLVLVDLCSAAVAEAKAGEPAECFVSLWSRLERGEADVRLELVGVFEAPDTDSVLDPPTGREVVAEALVVPYWLENANGIHFTDGRVGVGTSLPETLFQVGSWETATTRYLLGGDTISMQGIEGKDRLPYLEMRGEDGVRAFYLGWGSKANRVVDWKFENNYKLAIQGSKVGIGTTTPEAVLDVVGNLSVRNVPPDDTTPANASINLYSREAGGGKHRWALHSASVGGGFGVVPNSLTIWEYDGRTCTSSNPICHPRMVFEPNTGNVGIGTQDPQARLHVAGDLQLDGRLVSSGDICIGSCQ